MLHNMNQKWRFFEMDRKEILFKGEIPISTNNPSIFDRTFIIEQWFRRILYTALMISYGKKWDEHLSLDDRKEYNEILEKIQANPSLEISEQDNILWFTTINDLANKFINLKIGEVILEITEVRPEIIVSDLKEIKGIRNIVAHNRTVSMELSTRFDDLYENLNKVINNFKGWLIYSGNYKIINVDEIVDNDVINHFNLKLHGNDWKYFQAFIGESKYFYEIVHLPAGKNANYLDVKLVLMNFHPVIRNILGFFVNKLGDEYYVKWPKHESIETFTQIEIVDIFHKSKNNIWTDVPYEKQDSKFTCNPKVWFYENRRPSDVK